MSASAVPDDLLAACSREPIHLPGAIQPHGVLLVLAEPELIVLQASVNAFRLLGGDSAAVNGRGLGEVAPAVAEALVAWLAGGDPSVQEPVRVAGPDGSSWEMIAHRGPGGLIVEAEPGSERPSPQRRLQRMFADFRAAADIVALQELAVRFTGELTGFERVMLYRFDADWHGEVVAERRSAAVESYLGLHFPASDIPAQARELYRRSWVRVIPDANYVPVPIEPAVHPLTGQALDLSGAALRSVSPVHLEYLRNMGVGASMSISIVIDGELWGLVACHHRTARHLPPAMRVACELFGQVLSLEIGGRLERRRLLEQAGAQTIQTKFFDAISREQNVIEALVKFTPHLLEFMGAHGAAIHVNDRTTLLGRTPDAAATAELIAWLGGRELLPVFATDRLSEVFPPAAGWAGVASGVMAVRLSRVEPHYVLWFRPEVITTVKWAGRPIKDAGPDQRLHPRTSFAAWSETVRGRSTPWGEAEQRGARELVQAVNALVLRRTERLLRLNDELERKNIDLNSFAYIAAHDLREPLRGIANYCDFLREDHAAEMSPEAGRKLDAIRTLVTHSQELIDALNHYSRLGRIEISRRPTNLDDTLDVVLKSLEALIQRVGGEVRRPRPLPEVDCDPVLVREVFANLISNGLRYNTNAERWVEVAWEEPSEPGGPPVFLVRDNGIGIREKHYAAVFQIFRRLHAKDAFGGGTGAGLAIVRSIVERHGGSISLESVYGHGSTFRFTFA